MMQQPYVSNLLSDAMRRYRLADVLMTQRQIINRRIGLYGAMDAGQGPGPSTTGLQIKSL